MPHRLALVILITLAPAVHAQLDPDDATGRLRAREQMEGSRSAGTDLIIQREAMREAAKWRITQQKFQSEAVVSAGAVPAGTWVNVGPGAGAQLSPLPNVAVDTGRLRKIAPHPTDPNILYVATAGGGVWKTFNAQSAVTDTVGPRWFSITTDLASQSVGAFALDPRLPDTLYLGLGDPFDVRSAGFYVSSDGGATWQDPINLTGVNGTSTSVRDIVVDPSGTGATDANTPGVAIAATDKGAFRSANGGAWTEIDLGGQGDCWSVAWVGPQHWLLSCYASVYLSTNNGATFTRQTLPSANLGRMTLAAAAGDSADPVTAWIYLLASNAGEGDQGDVLISQNGGSTWASLDMGTPTSRIDNAYCAPPTDACKSPLNWISEQDTLDVLHDQAWYNQAIIVDPRDHKKVFIGGNLTMLRSDDAGHNWYVMTDWLPASPLCTPGCNNIPYVHADWHAMAVSLSAPGSSAFYCGVSPPTPTPGTSRVPCFYAGTDGGLFRSSDVFAAVPASNNSSGTAHFEGRIGRGLVTHLAYSIATDIHNSANPVMIGGLQDNGTRVRTIASGAAATTFNQMIGADGFGVGIGKSPASSTTGCDTSIPGSLLLGTIYGVIYRSVDCGGSFAPAMNGICTPGTQILNPTGGCDAEYNSNFFMKLTSDQADATGKVFLTVINNSSCDPAASKCTVASGTNTVYATHDGAGPSTGWVKANGTIHLHAGGTATNFSSQLISVGANSKAAGQWTVSDSSYAYFTTDSGANWTQSESMPGSVRGVAFEGAAASAATAVVWAASSYVSASGGKHVWRSVAGSGWVDKSGDLPNVPAVVVAVDPNDTNTVYLGTEIGMYVTHNGGTNWVRSGASSLPLVKVTEINVALDSSAVRISTFGRGFWELYPSGSAPAGVLGNGDFDKNQVIDAFDLVREAVVLGASAADPAYDPIGNLTGATNAIDSADFGALVAKMGGRP